MKVVINAFWRGEGSDAHFYDREVDRADPDLVDGSCARLRVVEIPDGVEYCIKEYDGSEHVAEQHRTWA